MSKDLKTYDRRQFLELATATAAALTLGSPPAIASTPKRGGTLTCAFSLLMQTPDPHRYTGAYGRQCGCLCWEGLVTPTPVGERLRLLEEQGPDAAIPEVQAMLADNWEIDKEGRRYVFHLKKGSNSTMAKNSSQKILNGVGNASRIQFTFQAPANF